MSKLYSTSEIREGLTTARAADRDQIGLIFKIKADWGQIYAKLANNDASEVMLCFATAKGFELPYPVWDDGICGYRKLNTFEEFYAHLKGLVLAKAAQAAADAAVELPEPKMSWCGNAKKRFEFPRPVSDEEFGAFGRKERLTPFVYPCGYVRRENDRTFIVDESTD